MKEEALWKVFCVAKEGGKDRARASDQIETARARCIGKARADSKDHACRHGASKEGTWAMLRTKRLVTLDVSQSFRGWLKEEAP